MHLARLLIGLAALAVSAAAAMAAGPPDQPRILDDLPEIGRPGGDLRTLVGRSRDTRLLFVYGHARLVGYDLDLKLVPDILESYDVQEGRIFTFRLRRGHRW